MLGSLLMLLMTALSLLVVDIIFPGVSLANFPAAMIAAVAIGGVNAVIKPVLSVLSLPVNFLTFGAFSFVINGLCFWLASIVAPGFHVSGLLAFILGPVILTAVNTVLNRYIIERYPLLNGTPQPQLNADNPEV